MFLLPIKKCFYHKGKVDKTWKRTLGQILSSSTLRKCVLFYLFFDWSENRNMWFTHHVSLSCCKLLFFLLTCLAYLLRSIVRFGEKNFCTLILFRFTSDRQSSISNNAKIQNKTKSQTLNIMRVARSDSLKRKILTFQAYHYLVLTFVFSQLDYAICLYIGLPLS